MSGASLNQIAPLKITGDSRANISINQPQDYQLSVGQTLPGAQGVAMSTQATLESVKSAVAQTPWYVWIMLAVAAVDFLRKRGS